MYHSIAPDLTRYPSLHSLVYNPRALDSPKHSSPHIHKPSITSCRSNATKLGLPPPLEHPKKFKSHVTTPPPRSKSANNSWPLCLCKLLQHDLRRSVFGLLRVHTESYTSLNCDARIIQTVLSFHPVSTIRLRGRLTQSRIWRFGMMATRRRTRDMGRKERGI
jgi:hypothetical protein